MTESPTTAQLDHIWQEVAGTTASTFQRKYVNMDSSVVVLQTILDKVTDISHTVEGLFTRIKALESSDSWHAARLNTLEQIKLPDTERVISSIQNSVTNAEIDLVQVRVDVARVRENVTALATEVETQVDGLYEEIRDLWEDIKE